VRWQPPARAVEHVVGAAADLQRVPVLVDDREMKAGHPQDLLQRGQGWILSAGLDALDK
jgi:hypothetical protein